MTVIELNQQHGLPGVVTFDQGPGGLTRAVLTGSGGLLWGSRAAVMLHGGHVIEFQPSGEGSQGSEGRVPSHRPVLWMSRKSWFEPGKPIRGGVPVCWPWFGNDGPGADCPNHGFARLAEWQVRSTARLPDGRAAITLSLESPGGSQGQGQPLDPRFKAWWPFAFELELTVTVGSDRGSLTMELTTRNPGEAPFTITEALHTYLAVSDVRQIRVGGLERAEYLDTVGTATVRQQGDQPITFTGETDRDYLNNTSRCVLDDQAWGRRIIITKSGSRSTVVWNPWAAKAVRMPDFGDDEWPGMVCIETANIRRENAVVVPAHGQHVLGARIAVEDR